jgi:hypothetical protein
MSDWPINIVQPLVTIHPWSLESIGCGIISMGGTTLYNASGTAYPTANLALFIPFAATKRMIAVKMFSINGTQSGNIDVGIYDIAGRRLVSMGSTAQAGPYQEFDIADTEFGPGIFYLAVAMDNNTGKIYAGTLFANIAPAILGMAQMASAFPLPATATFAQITGNYIPLIGLTTRTVL